MSEMLLLKERAINTIQLGESHFREFKSAFTGPPEKKTQRSVKDICKDISEALVAFSNADGGELLVGVEDDGEITGVPHSDADLQLMLAAPSTYIHKDTPIQLSVSSKIDLNSKAVLFFSVLKGSGEVYQLSDGRCVRRRDKETVPDTPRNIYFDYHEKNSREFDRLFVDGAQVADLDLTLLQTLADNYLRGLSIERYLQQIGVAQYTESGLRLRNAALLLFAKDILRWHPRCQVRVLKVEGSELKSGEQYNVTSDEQVSGNVFELLISSWETLRPFLASKTKFGADARFVQQYLYPEDACREALINAIAHRDYVIQNGIDVFIFNDRMEIRSPGALLSTLSIPDLESLTGSHESRNPFITRVLRENKFMRELGEGLKRIYNLMEENDLERPTLTSDGTSFTITLPHKSIFSKKQTEWLSLFKVFDLDRFQKRIVALGVNDREIAPEDIYNAMNTDDRDTYDREVTALRSLGILQEVRKNTEATRISKRDKIPKRKIGRFRIRSPKGVDQESSEKGVFVANLAGDADKEDLRKAFSQFGRISNVILPRPHKGFGFVFFENKEAARIAIRKLDRFPLKGKEIKTDKVRPKTNINFTGVMGND